MGFFLAIFSTGTYAIIGTTCVESETSYEKNLFDDVNLYVDSCQLSLEASWMLRMLDLISLACLAGCEL